MTTYGATSEDKVVKFMIFYKWYNMQIYFVFSFPQNNSFYTGLNIQ